MSASPPRRFVWPPRPVEVAAPEPRAARAPSTEEMLRPSQHTHVERSAAAERAPTSPTAATRPSPTTLRALLHSIEHIWLDRTTPPLDDRIAAAGWAPDSRAAYCSRCGSTVGPHEADDTGCPACRRRRLPWERMVRLGEYEGLLRDAIHEVKFTRWRRLGDQMGRILGRSLGAAMADAAIDPARAALVPVPTSFWRRMSRGIDHSLVICRGIAAERGLPILPLLRRSHRPSQTAVAASERPGNVAGSIRARRALNLSGWTVIVVDDVTTTRATLTAACRAVREGSGRIADAAGPSPLRVWTAVVAVTPSAGSARRGGGR